MYMHTVYAICIIWNSTVQHLGVMRKYEKTIKKKKAENQ